MTELETVTAALVDVLNNTSTRPVGLTSVKYPIREMQPHFLADGVIKVKLPRIGYNYKRRYPRQKYDIPIDICAVKYIVEKNLPEYRVKSVTVNKDSILLEIGKE